MRRLFPLCVAALLVVSNGFSRAQISDDVVKIGVLTDLSGPSDDRGRAGLGRCRANGGR